MWIPPKVGLLIYSLGIPALVLLPGYQVVVESGDLDSSVRLLEPEIATTGTDTHLHAIAPRSVPPWSMWKSHFIAQFRAVTVDYSKSFHILIDVFVHDKLSRICLTIFFFNVTAMGVRIILQQWASIFFHWTLVQTSYVVSFEMLVNALVLVSLPYLSRRFLRPMLGSAQRAELWVVKASLLMNIIGALGVSFAPSSIFFVASIAMYSGGGGLYDSLKSFATGHLQKEQITRFYVGISMVETIGGIIGGPLWTRIFSLTLTVEFLGFGLPFWLCSLCFLCAFTTVIHLERYLKLQGIVYV